MTLKSLALVGPGSVGLAAAHLFERAGYTIGDIVLSSRKRSSTAARLFPSARILKGADQDLSKSSIILVAVPDDVLPDIADTLSGAKLRANTLIVHTSGALTSSVFDTLKVRRMLTGSMHPLQTIPSWKRGMELLPGSVWTYEGNPKARRRMYRMITDIGGVPCKISSTKKGLYHLSAVLTSNYVTTLASLARQGFIDSGLPPGISSKSVDDLLRGTGLNLSGGDSAMGLTGPIVRGDISTVKKHLQELKGNKQLKELYQVLGRATTELAFKSGSLSKSDFQKIMKLL